MSTIFRVLRLTGALIALASAGASAVAVTTGAGPLQLQFVAIEPSTRTLSDNQGLLDLGTLAARPSVGLPAIVVRQRVGIRLEGSATSARLSVSLADPGPGILRINGIPVSTSPRVIDPAHRIGTTVTHVIELTIPKDVAPGPLLGSLQWLAESD